MMPLPSPSHRTKLTLSLKFVSWMGFSRPAASTRHTCHVPVAFERYAIVFPSGEKLGEDDARMLRYFSIDGDCGVTDAERKRSERMATSGIFRFILLREPLSAYSRDRRLAERTFGFIAVSAIRDCPPQFGHLGGNLFS